MNHENLPLVLYGAGRNAVYGMEYVHKLGMSPICFCDADTAKQGTEYLGLPVLSLEQAQKQYGEFDIYLTPANGLDAIRRSLANQGIKLERIVNDWKIISLPNQRLIDIMTRHMLPNDQAHTYEYTLRTMREYDSTYQKLSLAYAPYEKILGELCFISPGSQMSISGFCCCCNKTVGFLVSFAGQDEAGVQSMTPMWRESLVCPICGLNNRMRFMFGKIKNEYKPGMQIYIAEQVTKMYQELKKVIPDVRGSEYLNANLNGGEVINGIRHEDLMNLSFENDTFDMVISQDVLEHVADYKLAFREMYRVLKEKGKAVFTAPFYVHKSITENRTIINQDGNPLHILPPIYHADPLSSAGTLVYNIFSWDILEHLRDAGFKDARAYAYYSIENANLGILPLYFEAIK